MALLFHQNSLEPTIEKITVSSMRAIEYLGVDAVQLAHPRRKISFWSFNEKMVVVIHQTAHMAKPIEPLHLLPEDFKKHLAISIVYKNSGLFYSIATTIQK